MSSRHPNPMPSIRTSFPKMKFRPGGRSQRRTSISKNELPDLEADPCWNQDRQTQTKPIQTKNKIQHSETQPHMLIKRISLEPNMPNPRHPFKQNKQKRKLWDPTAHSQEFPPPKPTNHHFCCHLDLFRPTRVPPSPTHADCCGQLERQHFPIHP